MGFFRDEFGRLGREAIGLLGASLQKAAQSSSEETLEKTDAGGPVPTESAQEDPKALLWDPFSIVEQLGYKDRNSAITYGTLKAITYRMPIVQAIIQTRINQVAAFAVPQHDKYQIGFRVKLRESEKEPTKAELKWMKDMEALLMNTGVTNNPQGRDNFETFLRKITYDSLTYDQMTYEIVENKKGLPAELYAVDAATMRLADSASANFDEDDVDAVKYVQIYDGMIINEYTQNEMCFGIRNPRSDIRLQGYGVSELEMLITTITNLLYSWQWNQNIFTQGSAAKGVLNFKGTIPEKQLQAFRKQWYTQIASVQNAWKTPITNAEDLQYINMQTTARDMEFSAWMDFQIKVCCALYSMDPIELNFKYGNAGQKSALNESNNKEKITESKERGLRPLLRFIAQGLNQNFLWPINENFEFAFVGLDAKTQADTIDINTKRVKSIMMIDEIRAEDDLPPLPDGKGEVILDPTWLQFSQGVDGQQQGEEGAMFGEGEEGEEEPGGEEDVDYEKLLAEYEAEGDEDEEDEEESEKSLRKSFVVNL